MVTRTLLSARRVVSSDPRTFQAVSAGLLVWRVHALAGVSVGASVPASVGETVELRIGPRGLGLGGECEITAVTADAHLTVLDYASKPGHPEQGTQSLRIERDETGLVWCEVRSDSSPMHPLLRVFPMLGLLAQQYVALRYIRAARQIATARERALGAADE